MCFRFEEDIHQQGTAGPNLDQRFAHLEFDRAIVGFRWHVPCTSTRFRCRRRYEHVHTSQLRNYASNSHLLTCQRARTGYALVRIPRYSLEVGKPCALTDHGMSYSVQSSSVMRSQNANLSASYGCSRQQVARGRMLLGLARATQRTSAAARSPYLNAYQCDFTGASLNSRPSHFHGRSSVPHVLTRRRPQLAAAPAAQQGFFDVQQSTSDSSHNAVLSYLPSLETGPVDSGVSVAPRQLPRSVEGPADNPQLANPLERQNRLGTGWMGVIIEYEGVVGLLIT